MPTASKSLLVLDDDALLHLFTFLYIPDILAMRQTCKRISVASRMHSVWNTACQRHIIARNLPFVDISMHPPEDMNPMELEYRTRRAYRLSQTWLSEQEATAFLPRQLSTAQDKPVYDIRFLPGSEGKRFLTVSKGIWFQIAIWETDGARSIRKLTNWGPKGAIISGFTLNEDWKSRATVAVSIARDDEQSMIILSLQNEDEDGPCKWRLKELTTFPVVSYKPMMLRGDILAFSDDFSSTVIWNWRTRENAILQHEPNDHGLWQHDRCMQVVLAHESLLVVRARIIYLFPFPSLNVIQNDPPILPLAWHSFGWTDAISVRASKKQNRQDSATFYDSLCILACEEGDDPWSRQHNLHFYELALNPKCNSNDPILKPYSFPPTLISRAPVRRGVSRCQNIILGAHGTAIWVLPQDRANMGLVNPDLIAPPEPSYKPISKTVSSPAHETVVVAAFAGPLQKHSNDDSTITDVHLVYPQPLWTNALNDWTAIDYDEEDGRIALGAGSGKMMILSL